MADLFNNLLDSLDSLTEAQITELMSRLEVKRSGQENSQDNQELMQEGTKIIACPHCGSVSVKKHDKTKGKQRYRCKDCGKVFSGTTGTLQHHSKLKAKHWKGLIKGLILNLSIRQIADDIELSPQTVWYNKQKICNALQELFSVQDIKFSGIVECDEYIVRFSAKGKRDANFFINQLDRMPKHHRSRGEKIEYLIKNGLYDDLQKNPERLERLLSAQGQDTGKVYEKVSVLTCRDRNGNLYIVPVCMGRVESDHITQHLEKKINSDSVLVTDKYAAYKQLAEDENITHVQLLSKNHKEGAYHLAHTNALHSRIAAFWPTEAERDPATKYLDLQLILFWWLEKHRNMSISEQVDLLYHYMSEQLYDGLTYDKLIHRPLVLDTKHQIPQHI